MRFLFSCLPGFGHFHPMVPLARALDDAGHEVAFATAERFCRRVVEPIGFRAFPAGVSPIVVEEETARRPEVAALDPDDIWSFGAHMFAGVAGPRKVADLVRVVDDWSPAVVVHGSLDFAGPIAAARTGVARAHHGVGALLPLDYWVLAAAVVAPTWDHWGLTPEPLAGMFRAPYLDICPPSFQSTDIAAMADVHALRPVPFDDAEGGPLPPWVARLPPRPTVYVTLGTVFNLAPGLFETLLAGLSAEELNLVVTVGENRDPDDLGPQPDNVHVERYLPQSRLFPLCDAVVCHAGSGTVLGALGSGLPMVVVPQGANQFWNAERCAALGVGVRLLADELDPPSVRSAVQAVLGDPTFAANAGRVRREIEAMPPPEALVPLLEELAAGGPAAPAAGPVTPGPAT